MSTKKGREPYSDTHNHYRPGHFKETMSLIPRRTTFQDAWEHYSLREAFEGSSLTEEHAEGIYEILKLPTRPPYIPREESNYWSLTPLNLIAKKNDPAAPTEFYQHEASLDENSERKPRSRRKGDFKEKRAASKANEGIIVKGPDIKTQGESSRTWGSNLEDIPPEYCTNETIVADVNKFGDTGDLKLTHPEFELSRVSTTSDGRSTTTASQPQQS